MRGPLARAEAAPLQWAFSLVPGVRVTGVRPKKTARHCWRAVSVSRPTKESFLATGLSLAHPGNVLLNLSISLLLKRGQRLLLLRR